MTFSKYFRHCILGCLFLAAAGTGSGQWIHFVDETDERVQLASIPPLDDKEKDFATGDLNRDGWMDVIVVRKEPFAVRGGLTDVLFLNENGRLVDRTAEFAKGFIEAPTDARDVLIVDFDDDQWPDVVIANTFGQQPVFYRNLGLDEAGDWRGLANESGARFPILTIPDLQFCAVWAGDVTGNGMLDLYFSNYVRPPDIALDVLFINDGTGHFTDESAARLGDYRNSGFGTSVELHDMDLDGDFDIIKSSSLSPVPPWDGVGVFVLFNDGDGMFTKHQPLPTASPYMFTIGDLTNDGLPDAYIVNDSNDFVVITEAVEPDDPEPLTLEKTVLLDSPRTSFLGGNVRLADLDRDGDLDVCVADVDIDIGICETNEDNPRKFALFENDGIASGNLVDPYDSETSVWNQNVFDFALLDIDRDGKVDIFAGLCDGYAVYLQGNQLRSYPDTIAFPHALAEGSVAQTVRLCNNGNVPVTVEDVSVDNSHYAVSLVRFTLEPFGCIEVEVTFAPPQPGTYPAELTVRSEEQLIIPIEGKAFTPPRLEIDRTPVHLDLQPGGGATELIVISNPGGSDLEIEVKTRVGGEPVGNILAIAKETVQPAISAGLDAEGVSYSTVSPDAVSERELTEFELIVLGLAADPMTAPDMERIADAVRAGATLLLIGATADEGFLTVVHEELVRLEIPGGWQMPERPHFRVTDPGHPMADGLPMEHSFVSDSAAWYFVNIVDPDARVAARNSNGQPALVSKIAGQGRVIYFVNWPLYFVWQPEQDAAFFQQILANAMSFRRLSWLSVSPRQAVIPPGQSLELRVVVDATALEQSESNGTAEISVLSNDSHNQTQFIPIAITIDGEPPAGSPLDPLGLVLLVNPASRPGEVRLELLSAVAQEVEIQRSSDLQTWTTVMSLLTETPVVQLAIPLDASTARVFFRALRLR